jgi:glycerol uptake facilitator protein
MYDQHGQLYFWLPIVAPIIGGLIGGAIFKYMVEAFLPIEAESLTVSEPEPAENP